MNRVPDKTRLGVITRDGSRCARCARGIANIPASVHHRKPRAIGGTRDPRINDPRNLVVLCGTGTTGCHGWVESHRADALYAGWLIRSFDDLDAPCIREDGTMIYLTGLFGRVDVPESVGFVLGPRAAGALPIGDEQ